MIFIYAGAIKEAEWLAHWLGLDKKSWQFLTHHRQLIGVPSPQVIRWGRYHTRPNNSEMSDALVALNASVLNMNDDFMRFFFSR